MNDIGQDIENAVNSVAGRVMTAYQANANQARTTFGKLTLTADIDCMRRALIAEMREPSADMLAAPGTILQPYGARLVWERMFDTALERTHD